MKKMVKCYNKPRYGAEYAYDLHQALLDVGISEHDMLDKFMRYLPSDDSIAILEDLANEFDIDIDAIM